MPEHVFTLVARGHLIDAQTNQLTVFGIVEAVGSPSLPLVIPEMTVVTLWQRRNGEEGAEFMQRMRLVAPDSTELDTFEAKLRFDKPRMRMIGQLRGFRFEQEGLHRVEITVRPADEENAWSPVQASYPIEVQLIDSAKEDTLYRDEN